MNSKIIFLNENPHIVTGHRDKERQLITQRKMKLMQCHVLVLEYDHTFINSLLFLFQKKNYMHLEEQQHFQDAVVLMYNPSDCKCLLWLWHLRTFIDPLLHTNAHT
jgi:hypothetical protein